MGKIKTNLSKPHIYINGQPINTNVAIQANDLLGRLQDIDQILSKGVVCPSDYDTIRAIVKNGLDKTKEQYKEMKEYIGSDEHFQDTVNAHYDEIDRRNKEQQREPQKFKEPNEAWIILYGWNEPSDWIGSFPSDHYQQYYTERRNGLPHHFYTYEEAKKFAERECLINPIIIPIAGKYAMQMSEQNIKYELDGIHKNHLIQILGRLVKICDRYEKERQGLYEDELVTLNDAKFQLRLSAKERGQKNI